MMVQDWIIKAFGGEDRSRTRSNRTKSGNDLLPRESAEVAGEVVHFPIPRNSSDWAKIGYGGKQDRHGHGITQKTQSLGTYGAFPKLGGKHPKDGIIQSGNTYTLVHTGDDVYSRAIKRITAAKAHEYHDKAHIEIRRDDSYSPPAFGLIMSRAPKRGMNA